MAVSVKTDAGVWVACQAESSDEPAEGLADVNEPDSYYQASEAGDDRHWVALLRAADRLFKGADPETKRALVDAFAQDKLRLGNRAPRTKAEWALFRLAKQRRDLRERIRRLQQAHAACVQALTVEPDHQRLDAWKYELEGRLAELKRRHARLTRERDALETRLLRTRLERGEPMLPPRFDLRIRRRPSSA